MNGGKKTIRKEARKQARKTRQNIKATGKVMKKGGKLVAKGNRQGNKATKQSSKQTSKGGTPKQSTRYRAMDATVKKQSGTDMQKNPADYVSGKKTPKRKAYRTAPASGHGSGKYVNRKGRVVSRKKRR